MTNEELLAKIKAEIERNRQAIRVLNEHTAPEQMSKTCAIFQYSDTILSALLAFLDTLESEKPVPNDLEDAANKFAVFYDQGTCNGIAQDCFIAGAKWQADNAPLPEDTVLFNKGVEEGRRLAEEEQADLFTIVALDAAQRAKEQMMKEAVEGEVCGRVYDHINVRFADGVCKFLEPKNISHIPADVSKYKVGDKVRVIIVKED